jgi:hypothetical protein
MSRFLFLFKIKINYWLGIIIYLYAAKTNVCTTTNSYMKKEN